jgi:cytochrome c oxidase assembly protein subunit 15
MSIPSRPAFRGLHRFAMLLACAVVGLIAAGANVTSKDAGLSVPDWPTSYGGINPPRWYQIENVRAEHGHRLYAGSVALATLGLAVALQRREPRPWVRRLGWAAFGAVVAQALLGGITVLFFLPTAVSVAHAGLAQLFLCLTVMLALATSPAWRESAALGRAELAPLARIAAVTTACIYLQILLGAVMRHLGAGLAIPDFPLVFGGLVPDHWNAGIAVHYAHRLGALAVGVLVVTTAWRVFRAGGAAAALRPVAVALVLVVCGQITLGSAVVLSQRATVPNTAHVATGAALLALSWILTLGAWRLRRESRAAFGFDGALPAREAVA